MIPESYGIERVDVSALTAFSGNPRTHADTQIDQIAASILLVAIIAAVVLTYRGRKDSKKQSISDQVAVKAADRLRVVKMDAVKPQPAVSESSATEAGNGAAQ